MENVYEFLLKTLEHRSIAYSRRFFPTYLCSVGAHLMNIENKRRHIYFEHQLPSDLRIHVFMVAPPGFMKSYTLFQLLEPDFGLVSNVKGGDEEHFVGLKTAFEGSMTEAAWTGTTTISGEESHIEFGAAYEHQNAIVGIEEFSIVSDILKQVHSSTLANQLLTSLDRGYLRKRLAHGKIFYQTQVTLWTGSQPARFDLSSGLARRFYFIEFIPTKKEKDTIRDMRRKGQNITPDAHEQMAVNKAMLELCERVQQVQKISFGESLHKFFDEHDILHFEEPLYERVSLGYTVMTGNFDTAVSVEITPELKNILLQGLTWRKAIKMDSEVNQVVSLLRDNNGKMMYADCLSQLTDFGVDYIKGVEIINRAAAGKRIHRRGDFLSLEAIA